jgi:hypothetical protein
VEIPAARVWCEAIVQRVPEPLEPLDASVSEARNLIQSGADVDAFYTSKGRLGKTVSKSHRVPLPLSQMKAMRTGILKCDFSQPKKVKKGLSTARSGRAKRRGERLFS